MILSFALCLNFRLVFVGNAIKTLQLKTRMNNLTLPKTLTVFHWFSFFSFFFNYKCFLFLTLFSYACLYLFHTTALSYDDSMMEAHRKANKSAPNGNQFPSSTFPETFKDFFSMINEDEDQVELVSSVLEDKVRNMRELKTKIN